MNNVRGWKARRDAAEKRQKIAEARYESRKARASVIGQNFADVETVLIGENVTTEVVEETPVVVEPVVAAPEETVETAPAPAPAPKKGGRPRKQPETPDGFIIED